MNPRSFRSGGWVLRRIWRAAAAKDGEEEHEFVRSVGRRARLKQVVIAAAARDRME